MRGWVALRALEKKQYAFPGGQDKNLKCCTHRQGCQATAKDVLLTGEHMITLWVIIGCKESRLMQTRQARRQL
eukprot:7845318-Prorocentrum_lima.AAC.1